MNSRLFDCRVYHRRFEPKLYNFDHSLFMFYLDLDELDFLSKNIPVMSRNRFNLYSFYDADHWQAGATNTKQNILNYFASQGAPGNISKIYLLTHLRYLGYVFNPVSFYFGFDAEGIPLCAAAEVSNTFREMKMYYLGPEKLKAGRFQDHQTKYFYISPFMDLNIKMDFNLKIPDQSLELMIDEFKDVGGKKIFYSGILGSEKPLSHFQLLLYAFLFPLMTLQVIFLIHWHAWMLYLRKVPYFRKKDRSEDQRDMIPAKRNSK